VRRTEALRPRTVTGQITGLIILAVLFAVLLSFGAGYLIFQFQVSTGPNHEPPLFQNSLARVVAKADSLAEARLIVRTAQRAGFDVHELEGELAAEALRQPNASGYMAPPGEVAALRTEGVILGSKGSALVPLSNGGVVIFKPPARPEGIPPFLAFPVILVLSVIALSVVGLSIYAARSITAPLSSFVQAASRIGRGAGGISRIEPKGPSEIIQVANALNDMQERIQALLEERTSMLSAISHDLRTPLTRMKLRAERIVSASEAKFADGILADITHMEQMLAETISYLRDEGGGEAIQPIDLPSLLITMCTDLADLGNTISYRGPSHRVFWCRPTAIARAVSNVIDNALKFGRLVTVSVEEQQLGQIEIDVADDGPGIHYSLRGRVFEPFFKGDLSRRASNEGFGLGLAITKKIVEGHGGLVELFDCLPHGLRVRMTFPVART